MQAKGTMTGLWTCSTCGGTGRDPKKRRRPCPSLICEGGEHPPCLVLQDASVQAKVVVEDAVSIEEATFEVVEEK